MLGRRRRRRANIDPTLVQCLVFLGAAHTVIKLVVFWQADHPVNTTIRTILDQRRRRWANVV